MVINGEHVPLIPMELRGKNNRTTAEMATQGNIISRLDPGEQGTTSSCHNLNSRVIAGDVRI